MHRVIHNEGDRFGSLVIVGPPTPVRLRKKGVQIWYPCLCDCGKVHFVMGNKLRSGDTTSCGCWGKSRGRANRLTHGGSGTKLYNRWSGMRNRCSCPSASNYERYGGRGIRVCEEWQSSFEPFRDWALGNGYREGLSLERIDVKGNYSPDNCSWVTMSQQSRNKTSNILLTAFGETKMLMDWVDDPRCSISAECLRTRVSNYKWPHERAITTPYFFRGK